MSNLVLSLEIKYIIPNDRLVGSYFSFKCVQHSLISAVVENDATLRFSQGLLQPCKTN